ncbi:hypothetical protein CNMCM6805_008058 [Aspergillus fumigatiaffinis]|uniref:Rab-GAP TBC domain-containing protein n=1 Tax=Aspergillus fumigatiaffinis TaxID=340414 RepID=A0A8H4HFU5_9EURO|nr:hypothetical protein CNMCM5878_004783 [Aspergillus fumigatiaffinis]KAF4224878.1 hypothetical protein CNMCM6457_008837 [Aspergillus fumigatiaffinis]KAF4244660.1 hypothetical protein CNMCM6805_008058 [Aspergillus fumigatiaffinis]
MIRSASLDTPPSVIASLLIQTPLLKPLWRDENPSGYKRWDTLFRDNATPSALRDAIKSEQGDKLCNDGLRSAFLLFDDLDRSQWSRRTSESRDAYTALKAHYLKYIEHPDDLPSTIDPLADDAESPWQTLRQDEQMRADISQDVDRCLQENFFFREPATKTKMIDILFIYAKLNPDLGYRQGMHEVLAPILWVIHGDAVDGKVLEESSAKEEGDDLMLQLLNADYVEHDSFALFCSVMQTTRVYYEHNKERSANGQMDEIPIVNQCQHIHQNLLTTTDLELADHLQALEILPQIFLTRWMRLLFGREFPFQDVLSLWDLLFAEGLRSELIEFTCVAMLLRIRWQLLGAGYSSALTTLLRYPSPQPHSPQAFVHDGLYLEQNPTPERGRFLISKYSGKPPDPTKTLDRSGERFLSLRRFHLRNDSREDSQTSSPSRSPARSSPKSFEGLLQDFSEGLQRRTESWGVAKAVRGAVSEARRNMQAMQPERLPRTALYDSTPSAVHRRNLSKSEEPERGINLKAQIQILEERNKSLAKTLSQALNDIRTQLMKAEDLKATTADALRQALTQVQSVQTCLEDPSKALITVARRESTANDTSLNVPSEPPISTDKDVEDGGAKEGQQAPSDPGRPSVSSLAVENKLHKLPSSNKVPSSLPLRPAARPSLADSEFSWMLGGSRHLSSFVSPASVPPEETRYGDTRNKPHTLFGNGADEQQRSQDEVDSLALRILGGAEVQGQGSDSTY